MLNSICYLRVYILYIATILYYIIICVYKKYSFHFIGNEVLDIYIYQIIPFLSYTRLLRIAIIVMAVENIIIILEYFKCVLGSILFVIISHRCACFCLIFLHFIILINNYHHQAVVDWLPIWHRMFCTSHSADLNMLHYLSERRTGADIVKRFNAMSVWQFLVSCVQKCHGHITLLYAHS